MSTLREIIEAAQAENGGSLKDFTVLSVQVDPYRIDTPTGHAEGAWLAEQISRLNLRWRFHLRGLHYALVATGDVIKPSGTPYLNTEADWTWLQSSAAKAARWLGYVEWVRIVDERNGEPIIRERAAASEPISYVHVGAEITIPQIGDLNPRVSLWDFDSDQDYHLVIYGEKTSLGDVLDPIAQRYNASLYLPSGEISDTQLFQMANAGANDGRPIVVFICADFDPSGNQMAVSIGRKLQAFRDLMFPDLEFQIQVVALTEQQVREFNLPSTPLKESEKRADRWREAHGGLEQTEIDALATLRPQLLRQIMHKAISPFFDPDIDERVAEAKEAWEAEADQVLADQLDDDLLAKIKDEAEQKLAEMREEIDKLNESMRMATADVGVGLPPIPDPPEADPPGGEPLPLLDTAWSWAEQTKALIARKTYGNGGEAAP